jgi:hypothetical protein
MKLKIQNTDWFLEFTGYHPLITGGYTKPQPPISKNWTNKLTLFIR